MKSRYDSLLDFWGGAPSTAGSSSGWEGGAGANGPDGAPVRLMSALLRRSHRPLSGALGRGPLAISARGPSSDAPSLLNGSVRRAKSERLAGALSCVG
jgi:hypothetical protein